MAIKIVDKVNAQGETAEARLDDADGRIDQAVIHGMHHGVALGLAVMSTQVRKDFSVMPISFAGEPPEEIEDIDELLESYDDHATVLDQSTDAQSILNRLFDE